MRCYNARLPHLLPVFIIYFHFRRLGDMIFKNASQEPGKSSNIFGSGMSSSTSDGNNRLGNIFSSSLSSNLPSGQSSDAASSNIFGKQAPQESGELAKSSLWSSAPTDLSENPFKVPNIASGNID